MNIYFSPSQSCHTESSKSSPEIATCVKYTPLTHIHRVLTTNFIRFPLMTSISSHSLPSGQTPIQKHLLGQPSCALFNRGREVQMRQDINLRTQLGSPSPVWAAEGQLHQTPSPDGHNVINAIRRLAFPSDQS